MSVTKLVTSAGFVLAFAAGFALRGVATPSPVVHAQAANRFFEMRTYVASAGRYILAYPSREARDKSWAAFNADPGWLKAREASLVGGNPVARADSIFLDPVDYSPIK